MSTNGKYPTDDIDQFLAAIRKGIADSAARHEKNLEQTLHPQVAGPAAPSAEGGLNGSDDAFSLPALFRDKPEESAHNHKPFLKRLTGVLPGAFQPLHKLAPKISDSVVPLAASEPAQAREQSKYQFRPHVSEPAPVAPSQSLPLPEAPADTWTAGTASAADNLRTQWMCTHWLAKGMSDIKVQPQLQEPVVSQTQSLIHEYIDLNRRKNGNAAQTRTAFGVAEQPVRRSSAAASGQRTVESVETLFPTTVTARCGRQVPDGDKLASLESWRKHFQPSTANGDTEPNALSSGEIQESQAELLRPLLRQWLDENMMHVMERALEFEMSDPLKNK